MSHFVPDCAICRMKQTCIVPAMFDLDEKLLSTADKGGVATLWHDKAKLVAEIEKKMLNQIPAEKLEPFNGKEKNI